MTDTDNQDISISVVIPAYNSGCYLGRALDSVLAQTQPAAEIILVDDGSTDETGRIGRAYGPPVRYLRQENAGASAARNAGIEAAAGNWIAFLDADDEWLSEHLQQQRALLVRHPELVWSTGNFWRCRCGDRQKYLDVEADPVGRALDGREFFESYFEAYRAHGAGWTGTMLVKKEVLIEAGRFRTDQARLNDIDMWLRIAYRHPPIGYVAEPAAVYHMGVPNSIVKTYADNAILCAFLDRHLQLAGEHGRYQDVRPCLAGNACWWMNQLLEAGRGRDLRILLSRYGFLFSRYYRLTCYISSLLPATARRYERFKAILKNARPPSLCDSPTCTESESQTR
ncbi:MAG: glycosyltransferase family 2 protein [Sedimentisphaerales bacterium]|nr:glycosyltransferase family 2 protein [Sedimentisphaerales bacterium]